MHPLVRVQEGTTVLRDLKHPHPMTGQVSITGRNSGKCQISDTNYLLRTEFQCSQIIKFHNLLTHTGDRPFSGFGKPCGQGYYCPPGSDAEKKCDPGR